MKRQKLYIPGAALNFYQSLKIGVFDIEAYSNLLDLSFTCYVWAKFLIKVDVPKKGRWEGHWLNG